MQRFIIRALIFTIATLSFLACSNIDDFPQIEDKSNNACKLPSGQTVKDGFAGKDGGNNNCNYCNCSNGEYTCTEKSCR